MVLVKNFVGEEVWISEHEEDLAKFLVKSQTYFTKKQLAEAIGLKYLQVSYLLKRLVAQRIVQVIDQTVDDCYWPKQYYKFE